MPTWKKNATSSLQAAPHERSDQRQDYRNGYLRITDAIGTLVLQVPRTAWRVQNQSSWRYQRNEQAS